ncbi:MAG: hypothetical protein KDI55_00225 [Anaerolineae bacterium]|nr:hypothetical protein [Anaerolineae bacterium]
MARPKKIDNGKMSTKATKTKTKVGGSATKVAKAPPVLQVRLAEDLNGQLERVMSHHGVETRSDMIRKIIAMEHDRVAKAADRKSKRQGR